tara:strand:+ start:1471 stop:1701 length:231 start_codon:yes stop_codon:yes gene_type:complete
MSKLVIAAIALVVIYLIVGSSGNKLYSLGSVNPRNSLGYMVSSNKPLSIILVLFGGYFLVKYIEDDDEDSYKKQFK